MPAPTRTFTLTPQTAAEVRIMAEEAGYDEADLVRRALALMRIALHGKLTGKHIGLVRDRSKLDVVINGVLQDEGVALAKKEGQS